MSAVIKTVPLTSSLYCYLSTHKCVSKQRNICGNLQLPTATQQICHYHTINESSVFTKSKLLSTARQQLTPVANTGNTLN